MVLISKMTKKRLRLSEGTMGRSSPLCDRQHVQIVQRFNNQASQCKISSSVIIKDPEKWCSGPRAELKHTWLCAGNHCMGSETLLKTTVSELIAASTQSLNSTVQRSKSGNTVAFWLQSDQSQQAVE